MACIVPCIHPVLSRHPGEHLGIFMVRLFPYPSVSRHPSLRTLTALPVSGMVPWCLGLEVLTVVDSNPIVCRFIPDLLKPLYHILHQLLNHQPMPQCSTPPLVCQKAKGVNSFRFTHIATSSLALKITYPQKCGIMLMHKNVYVSSMVN